MPANSDEIVIVEGEKIQALPARPFRSGLFGKTLEDALQSLIERYPKLIPGSQIEPGNEDPPRFALLCREMGNASGSLDHLLVDQRGILTLLEAKLIQNPESRRAVVGQILEYAACAREAWSNGKLRVKATDYWQKKGESVGNILQKIIQGDFEEEKFWDQVEENLDEGKIRLIIATDELRPEIRRIIEYLNMEMKRARVYGLEIRCYGNESGSLVIVPTLVGQTQTIRESPDAKIWSVDELRRTYETLDDRRLGHALRRVLDWAAEKGFFLATRARSPGFGLRGRSGGRIASFFPDWTFCYLDKSVYQRGVQERDELIDELKSLAMYDQGLNPEGVGMGRNFTRKLGDLSEGEVEKLLDVFTAHCGKSSSGKDLVHG